MRWRALCGWMVAAAVVLWFLPAVLPSDYFVSLAARLLAMAVLVGSFNLLMSYLALSSFGHSALYGVGGYGLGLLMQSLDPDIALGLLGSLLTGGLFAVAIGPIMLRSVGIYFLLLSLAIGQVFWGIADSWRAVTGGSDGMIIYATPRFMGMQLDTPASLFRVAEIAAVLTVAVLYVVVHSRFGLALRGVRESDLRMTALGYNVFRLRYLAFTISGAVAGLAGGMVAMVNHFVSPDMMSVRLAVTLVLTVVLGGRGRFWGPLISALILFGLQEAVSAFTPYWPLVLGLAFIVSVYVLRFDLIGALRGSALKTAQPL